MKEPISSRGRLGITIAGLALILGFFLPWVRACGTDLTGLDIATNKYGNVELAQAYWLVLIAGLVAVLAAGFELLRRRPSLVSLVVGLVSSVVSGLPLLVIWTNISERKGLMQPRGGLYLSSCGALGMAISALLGLLLLRRPRVRGEPGPAVGSVACPNCGHSNPLGNVYCTNCGNVLTTTEGRTKGHGTEDV